MAVCNLPKVEDAKVPGDWPEFAQKSYLRLIRAGNVGLELNVRTEPAFQTLVLLDGVVHQAAALAKKVGADDGPKWMLAKYGAYLGASPAVKMIWEAAKNVKPYYDAFGMTASSVQDIVSEAISAAEDFKKL